MNCKLLVAGMLAAITAPVECSALRADTVRSIGVALQDSALIVARIWIVWSLILTIRVGIELRTVSRFRDHSLCHYRSCKGYKEKCSYTQECELLHDSSPCCRRDSTVEVSKVVPRGKAIRGSPTIRSSVAQPRLRLRPIFGRRFEVSGVIMMPSHDIGVQERALCSNRRSTCDCSR